ncbi:hypothetical protein C8R41DRAFT_916491 [Lentinula lateritia]|uniref:Uncharacterized protein n=1 Tax=Lentinula lateritia TaxID=40482 RepID=A0ABQ8VQA3_9AGAR|nr:hypothetical protein C8R41DRAFT_916491 [Lentinula lateritia]
MPHGDHEQLPETSQTHLINLHLDTDSTSTKPSLDPNPTLYSHLRSYPEQCLQHPYRSGLENPSSATLSNRDEFPVVDDLNQLHREPYYSYLWHHPNVHFSKAYRNRQTPVFIRTEPRPQRVMSGYIDPLSLSKNPAKRSLDHIHQCNVSG